MSLKGAIFDLDGVIVNTVPVHFKAWKKMFAKYGKRFTFQDYKEKVDGIPRLDGARAILTDFSHKQLEEAGARKQRYFLKYLKLDGIQVYKTTINLIKELRSHKIKIAVISSSKNCPYILEKTGLYSLIDVELNGNDIAKGKPDPQIFLMALDRLRLKADECIVFEDAVLGVEAAKRADIVTVGINRHKGASLLKKADVIVRDLKQLNYHKLKSLLAQLFSYLNLYHQEEAPEIHRMKDKDSVALSAALLPLPFLIPFLASLQD